MARRRRLEPERPVPEVNDRTGASSAAGGSAERLERFIILLLSREVVAALVAR